MTTRIVICEERGIRVTLVDDPEALRTGRRWIELDVEGEPTLQLTRDQALLVADGLLDAYRYHA